MSGELAAASCPNPRCRRPRTEGSPCAGPDGPRPVPPGTASSARLCTARRRNREPGLLRLHLICRVGQPVLELAVAELVGVSGDAQESGLFSPSQEVAQGQGQHS